MWHTFSFSYAKNEPEKICCTKPKRLLSSSASIVPNNSSPLNLWRVIVSGQANLSCHRSNDLAQRSVLVALRASTSCVMWKLCKFGWEHFSSVLCLLTRRVIFWHKKPSLFRFGIIKIYVPEIGVISGSSRYKTMLISQPSTIVCHQPERENAKVDFSPINHTTSAWMDAETKIVHSWSVPAFYLYSEKQVPERSRGNLSILWPFGK